MNTELITIFYRGDGMAQRRMFSKKIINSAKFLKMPVSTQCLYFHLGLNADDEGVVEGFNIMRMISATEDDLKILVAKEFVIVLNEDLVSYITHWNEHNLIRAERKVDSIYKDLLIRLTDVEFLEGNRNLGDESQMSPICQTNDSQVTDKCQHRLGKDRLGKVKLGKERYLERVLLTQEEHQQLTKKYEDETLLQKGLEILNNYIQAKEPKYKSHYHVMIGWVYERVMKNEKPKRYGHDRNTSENRGNEKTVTNGRISKYTSKEYL